MHDFFSSLPHSETDYFSNLIKIYSSDGRSEKVSLGLGVYTNDDGTCPIMKAVIAAERAIIGTRKTKTYPPMEGSRKFCSLVLQSLFPELARQDLLVSCQTIGASGALRLISDVVSLASRVETRIWLPSPTWSNHLPLLSSPKLSTRTYDFIDENSGLFDLPVAVESLREAKCGDTVLIHACCHNPTGIDPSESHFCRFIEMLSARGIFIIIDASYIGFGNGLAKDCARLALVDKFSSDYAIALSFSKNFGLYSDRVGAAIIKTSSSSSKSKVFEAAISSIRCSYSMPPTHGADVIEEIFASPKLFQMWKAELESWRRRILSSRLAFSTELSDRGHVREAGLIANQIGMFSLLNIGSYSSGILMKDCAIYLGPNGRINFSGVTSANVSDLVSVLSPHLMIN